MNTEFRERLLKQLREPNPKADMLIERYLGNPAGVTGCRPYTQDVEVALTLLPDGVHFLCGRFEEGKLFWCDVGFRPQVQAWGSTMASAIAGAIFAYRTHPDVGRYPDNVTTDDSRDAGGRATPGAVAGTADESVN